MKWIVYITALFAAALGTVIAYFLVDIIDLPDLINAIVWFLIAFTTYFFAKKVKDESWFKMLTLDFFITWAFTTIGVILGTIVVILIDTNSLTLNWDSLVTTFFASLPLALGPTATASMGLRE